MRLGSKLKSTIGLFGAMMTSFMTSDTVKPGLTPLFPSGEEMKRRQDAIKASKGLTPFHYGDNVVWALNRKNADRKAKKLNLI